MTDLEKLYRNLYPIGTKVAYDAGMKLPKLGKVIGYSIHNEGYYYEDTFVKVEDYEFPEYVYDLKPGKDIKKVYYTQKACDRDARNRDFL